MLDAGAARAEIAAHLWRYLSASASASPRPLSLDDVPLLLRSDVKEIRVRAALAVLQAADGEFVIRSIEEVLRRLPTAISFDRSDLHGQVRGRVDWPSTRLRSVNDPAVFVCRVPRRSSDLPVNRTLRAVIEGYLHAIDTTIAAMADSTLGRRVAEVADGSEALRERSLVLRDLLMHPKLVGIRSAQVMEPVRLERLVSLGLDPRLAAADVVEAMGVEQETAALLPLISRHLLSPARPSQLLEMLVAARVVGAFEQLGFSPLPWRIITSDRRPFAELVDSSGRPWSVYWQKSHWGLQQLDLPETSRYMATMSAAGVPSASLRPDLVVVPPSGRPVLFEVKYTETEERSRESAGLIDMMAYLWDMGADAISSGRPLGVVVAHGSAAIIGAPPILVCDEHPRSLRTVVDLIVATEVTTSGSAVEPRRSLIDAV